MLQSFTDLIYENNNALTTETCEDIIQRFRHDNRKSPGITTSGEVMPELKKSIDLAISDLDEWEDIDRTLFKSLADNLEEKGHKVVRVNYQPTCELMILDFSKIISNELPSNIKLYSLKLRETETSFSASTNITGFKAQIAKVNAEKRLAYDIAEKIRIEILLEKDLLN